MTESTADVPEPDVMTILDEASADTLACRVCGALVAPYARRLLGVDLSAKMIAHAQERKVYDSLVKSELTTYLRDVRAAYDVIVSADTLVYFGPLEDVIAVCAPDGDVGSIADEARGSAAALLDAAQATGTVPVRCDEDGYPPLLRAIRDPPPILWMRGSREALLRPAVAIVGSRAASSYAMEVAARLGGELADRGLVVVSGLARGADGAAHRGSRRVSCRGRALQGAPHDRGRLP